jgi:3-oxoadipate enol-lactonase
LINASVSPVRVELDSELYPTDAPRADTLTLTALLGHACRAFGIQPVEVVEQGALRFPTACERIVARRLDLSALRPGEARVCSRSVAASLIEAVAARDPKLGYEVQSIRSRRGAQLDVYQCGDPAKQAWLLVLPYGVPAELCFELGRQIGDEYRFVTFEGPDLLSAPGEFDRLQHGVDAHADDILSVVEHLALSDLHLAGVCAGVIPALRFANLHAQRICSVILGNGAYATKPSSPEDFLSLVARIDGRQDKARVFFKFMSAQDLALTEPEFPHLTMVPYCHPDLLYKFAAAFNHYYKADSLEDSLRSWIASLALPSLVIVGARDKLIPPESSRQVARELQNGRLLIDERGTHLSLIGAPNPVIQQAMLAFCREQQWARGAAVRSGMRGT